LDLGPSEILIILVIVVLLFGAKKLPELARGSGRALRIFKTETKGLMDDDEDEKYKTDAQRQIDAHQSEIDALKQPAEPISNPTEQPRPDAER
jgi:sec-independent protein translocase protein TatA